MLIPHCNIAQLLNAFLLILKSNKMVKVWLKRYVKVVDQILMHFYRFKKMWHSIERALEICQFIKAGLQTKMTTTTTTTTTTIKSQIFGMCGKKLFFEI